VKAGAKVMAVDVDEERLVNSVLPLGPNVRIQRVDVSNDAEVKAAVDFAVQAFGSLQVAVNCAGILGPCKTLSKGELSPFRSGTRSLPSTSLARLT
jgi:NAD(P)-dependent dehydrogenase (short-subunit alcohol dehydrogenase family)